MDFVVLSSSRGTVFQSVVDAIKAGKLSARCKGMVADRADRGCVEIARAADIPVAIVEHREEESREQYDQRMHDAIITLAGTTPLIACMGWMFILSPWFVARWRNRILNVHPALLPKHKGAHAHDLVLQSGDKESGMTIHVVDEGVDTGRILLQKSCPVLEGDTVDTLKARVQALEKEWYPKALQMIEEGTITISERP